ncbi:MAG TPA: MFS transporter, partial [Puia sp.]|nr:MFS transporter [Puia sp.]
MRADINMTELAEAPTVSTKTITQTTVYSILLMISFSHMLNDTIQSLIPSIYPLVKKNFNLNFTQIGLITLTFQLAASLLQPLVGTYTDRRPKPFSLVTGMGITLIGLICLSRAGSFHIVLVSVGLIGVGSSVFHPEASKVAYMASGGRRGLAQSIFQVGGNAGTALGPLLAAAIVVPFGQPSIAWFSLIALAGVILLSFVSSWYKRNHLGPKPKVAARPLVPTGLSSARTFAALAILAVLVFSKYIYMQSLTSYYTFYTIETFGVSVQTAQVLLFVFLFS